MHIGKIYLAGDEQNQQFSREKQFCVDAINFFRLSKHNTQFLKMRVATKPHSD